MTKPAFIYFQKSAHLLILVDVLSQRDAFIQIGGRISRGVKAVNEISGRISRFLDSSSASSASTSFARGVSEQEEEEEEECGKR